ncbi:TonB-dependent receptor [Asinibacterium sp. OR53]|uniref:SusC/RagA family TonB-linked outer membrane protein n=1 Tax=Asinibacterium sp. OR53 TaxID=925409 RepID=UPI00047AC542|nr:TonB-dependent receptor [Asinibacterium sp. OR53]
MKPTTGFFRAVMSALGILFFNLLTAQTPVITGRVTTQNNGEPLQGVSVVIKDKKTGVQTAADGSYSIKAQLTDTLLFSYSGYALLIAPINNQSRLNVSLQLKVQALGDVVVVGYGTQKKGNLTGSVASVSAKEIQKMTTGNVASALQGRTPGVSVLSDGGVAGAAVNIVIRGASSLTNVAPLYVIDGAFATDLSSVNPNDIESIDILKDASSAAIYGSRAANGVVLVTTKKGTPGKTRINFNTSYGLQTPAKMLSYLNARQYADLMNTVSDAAGTPRIPFNDAQFNPAINEDYQRLWLRNAPMFNAGLDFSGGQKESSIYSSFNYFNQQSLLVNSEFKRYDFRLNTTQVRNKFKLEESFSVNRNENKPNYAYTTLNNGLTIPTIANTNPDLTRSGVNSNGFNTGNSNYYIDKGGINLSSPYAAGALSSWQENTTTLTGSIKASYEITRGLVYSLGLSGNYVVSNTRYNTPNYTLTDLTGVTQFSQQRSLTETRGEYFQYTLDNLLSYKKEINGHDIDVLLGQSWLAEKNRNIITTSGDNNFPNNAITVPQGNVSASGQEFSSALLSVFGRINYGYKNRYLLSVSARNDQSTKFAETNRSGIFPSVSAGWNIHHEPFFSSKLISLAKIRISYGELGANFIPPYSYFSTVNSTVPVIFGNVRQYGSITQLANSNLKWETSQTSNIGIDLGILSNKITLSVDYFYKKNIDLLASLTPPPSSGQGLYNGSAGSAVYNSASIENKGFEASLAYHKTTGIFKFNITANASQVKNKVIALGDNVLPINGYPMSAFFGDRPTITQPGLPVGAFWGYRTTGIYQSDAEVAAGPEKDSGKKAGDLKFADLDNNGKIDNNDKTMIGTPFPKLEYSLNFSGSFKAFDFTLYLAGAYGNQIFNLTRYANYFQLDFAKTADALDAWTPQHTNTAQPRLSASNRTGGNALPSSYYIEDGSYLRLKNLQAGYSLLKDKCPKLPFSRIRFYAGVQNLLTFTHYSGYDPELGSAAGILPGQGTDGRGTGANVLFNRGVDIRAYPRDRTYIIGIQASF